MSFIENKAADNLLKEKALKVVRNGAIAIAREAKRKVSKDTGALASTISVDEGIISDVSVSVAIGAGGYAPEFNKDVDYALEQEVRNPYLLNSADAFVEGAASAE